MKENKKNRFNKILLIGSIIICTCFFGVFCFISFQYNKYDLDIDKLTRLNNGIKVYSSTGTDNTLYNTNRSIIEIETLPNYVVNAFVDVEDKRFYSHNGYDMKRIIKAFLVNATTKSKSQGASTISQQLIKNTLLTNEKTYQRKMQEIVLAIKMEKEFTKDEILEMYLNTIYFGSNSYGIENASKTYFNKSAKDLTINEACCLAGIIKSPANYSPKYNYENAKKRKNFVAKAMLSNKNITQEDYDKVVNEEIILSESNISNQSYEKEAIYEACSLLNISERELINRNYEIITFKDDNLQNEVIKNNNSIINNENTTNNTNLDSVSIVANNQGHIQAYYSNSMYDLHKTKRQPASLLKPLAVYLPCIQHNILTPASLILDEEIDYNGYKPNNADNKFYGHVSVRDAVKNSLNIPAVKALDFVGLKKSKDTLESLGINIHNSDMNLALALGSMKQGVNLIDIMNAYSTIANMGTYKPLTFIDKIYDSNKRLVYSHSDYYENVLKPEDCFILTDILKDTAETGTAKRFESLNLPIASKTGTASTNKGNTDLYNLAYTSEHTIISWIADIKNNFLPDNLKSSIEPTEINKKILNYLYQTHKPSDFIKPENVNLMPYDLIELETNKTIVTPNHDIERYIAYDYFKDDFPPKEAKPINDVNLVINLSKYGAELSFNTVKNMNYSIYRKINDNEYLLTNVKDSNDIYSIIDNNIFNYNEISYYVKNSNSEIISEIITIKPKDFLINTLNNEILNNKKKWYV